MAPPFAPNQRRGKRAPLQRGRLALVGAASAATCSALWATSAARAASSVNDACSSSLYIEAPPAARTRLRSLLASGMLGQQSHTICTQARVELVGQAAPWHVTFVVEGRSVTREVMSLDDAAAWIESWLAPYLDPLPETESARTPGKTKSPAVAAASESSKGSEVAKDQTPAPVASAAAPATSAAAPVTAAPASTPATKTKTSQQTPARPHTDVPAAPGSAWKPALAVGPLGAIGSDGSFWGGASAGLLLTYGDHWWVTGAASAAYASGPTSAPADTVLRQRMLFAGTLAGGPRFQPATGWQLGIGFGGVVTESRATCDFGGVAQQCRSIGVAGAGSVFTTWELGHSLVLWSSISGWLTLRGISTARVTGEVTEEMSDDSTEQEGEAEDDSPTTQTTELLPPWLALLSVGLLFEL